MNELVVLFGGKGIQRIEVIEYIRRKEWKRIVTEVFEASEKKIERKKTGNSLNDPSPEKESGERKVMEFE